MRRPELRSLLGNDQRIASWNRLGCKLSPDSYIGPHVVIGGTDVTVGQGSALTGRVELAAWGTISIGDRVMISGEVHVLTGSHDVDDPAFGGIVRPVTIADNVWIAQGAVILPGVTIGEGAVVGAYSIVGSDVEARTVVAGNPARLLRKRRHFEPSFIPADWKRFGTPWLDPGSRQRGVGRGRMAK